MTHCIAELNIKIKKKTGLNFWGSQYLEAISQGTGEESRNFTTTVAEKYISQLNRAMSSSSSYDFILQMM